MIIVITSYDSGVPAKERVTVEHNVFNDLSDFCIPNLSKCCHEFVTTKVTLLAKNNSPLEVAAEKVSQNIIIAHV